MSQLSADVLLETIHYFRDTGYTYSIRDGESCQDHIIELGRGLQLVLKIVESDLCYFSIRKNFRDGSSVIYCPETTEVYGQGFVGFALTVNEDKLEMDIPVYELAAAHQQSFIRNVRKLPYARAHSFHDRYSAEYDHINKLPINLIECTDDEFLLRYFSKNSFVTTRSPQDQQ